MLNLPPTAHDRVGYYSLIQYCPDRSRAEVVNIGLVLIDPEKRKLVVRTTPSHSRVKRILYDREFRDKNFDAFRCALEDQINREEDHLSDAKTLQDFAIRMCNSFVMTKPRVVLFDELSNRFESMFSRLVDRVTERRSPREFRDVLTQRLSDLGVDRKLERDVPIRIGALGKKITFPLAYMNGQLNVIQPATFAAKKADDLASRYAMWSRFMEKEPDPDRGPASLIVVGKFNDEKTPERVERILEDADVKLVKFEKVGSLADDIREHGRDRIDDETDGERNLFN